MFTAAFVGIGLLISSACAEGRWIAGALLVLTEANILLRPVRARWTKEKLERDAIETLLHELSDTYAPAAVRSARAPEALRHAA